MQQLIIQINHETSTQMINFTIITEFHFMKLSNIWELQILHAVFLLLLYLATVMANLLTIAAIITDPHLHFPMYFFLSNLSLLDICYISVILPKFIVNSLTKNESISLTGCTAQFFLVIFFGATELALLVTMSYDRFVAICHPLHYGTTMTPARCLGAVAGSCLGGLLYSASHTGNMFRLPLSGSTEIQQFFCDVPQILKVASPDVYNAENVLVVTSSSLVLFCFVFLIISYSRIFSNVLKIPSVEGRYKALSTCFPHLIVLLLFVTSGIFSILGSTADSSPVQNLLIGMAYTILPPFMNPIIYSLRNRQIKIALERIFKKLFYCKDTNDCA